MFCIFSSKFAMSKRGGKYGGRMYQMGNAARTIQQAYRKSQFRYNVRANRGARFARTLQVIPRRINQEVKTVDLAATFALNSTGVVTPINLIRVGSTFCNRIGRRIEMRSIYVTGRMNQTGTQTSDYDYTRVMLIYDRQTNGATPTISTILANYTQATVSSTNSLCGLNPDQKERFLVLMDERRVLPAAQTTNADIFGPVDGTYPTFQINRFVKLRGLMTHYQADSSPAVVGDISTGGLFLVTFGQVAAGSEGFDAQLNLRLRYNDA